MPRFPRGIFRQKLFLSLTWQRVKDSNPHKRSQSPVCYLYTNPLYAFLL